MARPWTHRPASQGWHELKIQGRPGPLVYVLVRDGKALHKVPAWLCDDQSTTPNEVRWRRYCLWIRDALYRQIEIPEGV